MRIRTVALGAGTVAVVGGAVGIVAGRNYLADPVHRERWRRQARIAWLTSKRGTHFALNKVRGLGADEASDYNTTDFRKVVSNCDAVFDTVGGDVALRSFAVLKSGGRAAFIASGGQAPKPDRSDVTSLRPAVGRDRAHLDRIVELYQAGAVRPPPVTVYNLSDAGEALRVSESRHLKGKLILKIR